MTPQERGFRVRQMGARHDWWALRPEPATFHTMRSD